MQEITRDEMLQIPANEVSDLSLLCEEPQVSILMMTRNHALYLRQAVESAIAQNFDSPLELLIGEDYSSDDTREIALELQREYPHLIRLIAADRNVGITANFLRLVVRARGKYVAFLEGDDYWTNPQKLQLQVDQLESHPEYAWSSGRTANRITWLPPKESYNLEDILRRYVVHTSTVVFRTEYLSKYPKFPDTVCWESMLLGYLTNKGECGFINREFSYYRRHEGGLWHNADRLKRLDMSRLCIDSLDDFFEGRYRHILADRELWIYSMDVTEQPGKGFWGHWVQSLKILANVSPRMFTRKPVGFLGLWLRVLLQPLTSLVILVRRRLALRSRFAWLMEMAGRR